jgi:hypothetical protein
MQTRRQKRLQREWEHDPEIHWGNIVIFGGAVLVCAVGVVALVLRFYGFCASISKV